MKPGTGARPFQPPPRRGRGLWGWTGFGKKTLWDWLQLLIVPVVIGVGATVGAAWFTEQRTQEEALQSYLDQMGQLMTDEGLRESESGDAVRSLARARTLTVLDRLDSTRKASVLRFLSESDLITKEAKEEEPSTITLPSDAFSEEGTLTEEAKQALSQERQQESRRGEGSPLIRSSAIVNLQGANLRGIDIDPESKLTLVGTKLGGTDLRDSSLIRAGLDETDLVDANLMGADLRHTSMRGADLRAAQLDGADLTDADLTDANLKGALLKGTKVSVSEAKAVTQEQLDEAFLEGKQGKAKQP